MPELTRLDRLIYRLHMCAHELEGIGQKQREIENKAAVLRRELTILARAIGQALGAGK
jgi:hypothetical protein